MAALEAGIDELVARVVLEEADLGERPMLDEDNVLREVERELTKDVVIWYSAVEPP